MANWWLISWTTYGTWLPGDKRGFCTWRGESYIPPPKRYAKPGDETYRANEHTKVHELALAISGEPVYLTQAQMRLALPAIVEEIAQIPIVPAILSIGEWHIHWLCYFGPISIRAVVSRIKAAATRELNAHSFQGKKPWAKGCNMRSKSNRRECRNAYRYVLRHEEQGCLVYRWPIDPQYLVFD
jgi:hypothetical protein